MALRAFTSLCSLSSPNHLKVCFLKVWRWNFENRVASPMSSCFCSALQLNFIPLEENDLLEKHTSDLFVAHFKSPAAANHPHISQSAPIHLHSPPSPSLSSLCLLQDNNEDHATTNLFLSLHTIPGSSHARKAFPSAPSASAPKFHFTGIPSGHDCCFILILSYQA